MSICYKCVADLGLSSEGSLVCASFSVKSTRPMGLVESVSVLWCPSPLFYLNSILCYSTILHEYCLMFFYGSLICFYMLMVKVAQETSYDRYFLQAQQIFINSVRDWIFYLGCIFRFDQSLIGHSLNVYYFIPEQQTGRVYLNVRVTFSKDQV